MKLIHISDIHINPEPILDMDPIENFQACIAHVEKYHRDADMVIISGDLTHHGQRSCYEKLKDMIDGWSVKPHLMIGNHDDRETFQQVFPETPKDTNGYVQYVVKRDDGHFIMLDTVRKNTHAGHFGKDRQTWFKKQLDAAREAKVPAYVFMHHNPVDTGVRNADIIGLVDGKAFRNILTEYKDCIRHIFFGHCHYILSGSVCGIPMSAPRSTNHPCVPDLSGSETLMGAAPFPPTYDACVISDDAVIVHSIDFLDDDKITWYELTPDGWIAEPKPEDA